MKVYRKIYSAQKAQRCLLLTSCAWFLSLLSVSMFGSMLSAALMAASVVFGVMSLSRNSVARKDMLRETLDVNVERISRISRVLLFVCLSASAVGVVCCALFCEKDFTSAYGTVIYIMNVLSPAMLMFIPAYANAAVRAAEESSVSEPLEKAGLKIKILSGQNICALVIGFLASYMMLFYVYPMASNNTEQHRTAQNTYLTHDISESVQYKSQTLSECDVNGLLTSLPDALSRKSFSVKEDALTVYYSREKDTAKKHGTIVYNATALFAMIDDLRRIDFIYGDETTTVFRADTVCLYDDFPQILNTWQTKVSYRLKNSADAEQAFSAIAKTTKK